MAKISERKVHSDALKSAKRSSREEEIRMYGHLVSYARVFRNRKRYTRKVKHSKRSLEND